MKEAYSERGAAVRVLLSFGVIVAVLALAIGVAKIIQGNSSTAGKPEGAGDHDGASSPASDAGDSEPDAGPSEADDAGTDASRGETLCEGIAKEIEATAARKLGAELADASGWLLPDLFRDAHCVAARSGGIWAMVPSGVRPKDASAEIEVLWDVVYVSAKGERMALPQPPFVSSVDRSLDLEQPTVFDFDGDGQDEVLLTGSSWVRDGASSPYGRMWTLKGGKKIEPYARAPEFGSVEDIDDDGRPDLLTNGPYVLEASPTLAACGVTERRIAGPLLVLHSLPDGSFAAADDHAMAYAKKACPARPKSILTSASGDAAAPGADSVDTVACARLWGMSEADLTALVNKECRALRPLTDAGARPLDTARPLDAGARPSDAGARSADGGGEGRDPRDPRDTSGKASCSGEIVCDDWALFRPWLHAKPPLLLK
ncbi:FG-GAP repeat domain-containing protein [Pendulispora albinea]|uniref:VCBS repeat-containing protein n=1 Tax=Pendulispora albinea TaxID=2741071 RepID=A0ABZ2LTR0_9BACT